MATYRSRLQRYPVHSDDPSLSAEANRALTGELRDALGCGEVGLSAAQVERLGHQRHGTHGGFVTELAANRLFIGISFLVFVVIGAVVALVTDSWWVLVGSVAVHAVCTLLVAGMVLQLTTETEHVSPEVAALLEEEGVADPDRLITELVEDFAGDGEAHGVPEIISSGANELTVRPEDDPGRATVEQRTAMTPTGRATTPGGSHSGVAAMPALVVASTAIVALVAAIVNGGTMWLATVVVWGAAAVWFAIQRSINEQAEEQAGRERHHDPTIGPHRPVGDVRTGFTHRLAPILVFVTGAVALFMVVVALLDHSA